MNYNVKLLDCTLRDGGFVNDWNFGNRTINSIVSKLKNACVDIIEVGFLDSRRDCDYDKSIQPTTADMGQVFKNRNKAASMVVGMIDYGTCPLDNIELRSLSFLDGIRVIFKKKDIDEALEFCRRIKDKGYNLFIQPVSVTSYTEWEMIDLIAKVNKIKPYALSIVDTYGLMHKNKLFKLFYLLDSILSDDISIGYHSHNNFQLAYSNCIELLSIDSKRQIVLDASCYGMGKSAGNACTELLAMYLNDYCKKNYNINSILEIIDVHIMPIFQKKYWGYSLEYFLAASNDCHPNYVKYFLGKKTLKIQDINDCLAGIEPIYKLSFNEKYAEKLYKVFQKQHVDDSKYVELFRKIWNGKKILVLAPGMSLRECNKVINSYINNNDPIIVSMNFFTEEYPIDYIFISNTKRYQQMIDMGENLQATHKLILTSNVDDYCFKAAYVFDYLDLLNTSDEVSDTSVLMFFKLLIKIGIREVAIAGFDGFCENGVRNYFEEDFMFESNMDTFEKKNYAISMVLTQMKELKIEFITKTLYRIGEK